jgi:hypothetical protein
MGLHGLLQGQLEMSESRGKETQTYVCPGVVRRVVTSVLRLFLADVTPCSLVHRHQHFDVSKGHARAQAVGLILLTAEDQVQFHGRPCGIYRFLPRYFSILCQSTLLGLLYSGSGATELLEV